MGPRDNVLEKEVKLIQEVVRVLRSQKQDYLPPKARPEGGCGLLYKYRIDIIIVSLIVKDEEAGTILKKFQETIITLSQISK